MFKTQGEGGGGGPSGKGENCHEEGMLVRKVGGETRGNPAIKAGE